MAKKRAGWERKLYIGGTPGSTASTHVPTAIDVNLGMPAEFTETTTRGDGSAVPKKTETKVKQAAEPSFSFFYKDSDAPQATILAAIKTNSAIAIKIEDFASGSTEFDGDCYVEADSPGALADGRLVEVTCHPTDDAGRDWAFS